MGGLHGPAVGASALLARRAEHGPLPFPLVEAKWAHTSSASTVCLVQSFLQARVGPGAAVSMQAQRTQQVLRKEVAALAQGGPEQREEVCRTQYQRLGAAPEGRAVDSHHAAEGRDAGQVPPKPWAQPPLRPMGGLAAAVPSEVPRADDSIHTPAVEATASRTGPPQTGTRESEGEVHDWGRWRQQELELFDGCHADAGEPPPLLGGLAEDCRPCDNSQTSPASALKWNSAIDGGETAAGVGREPGTATAGDGVIRAETPVPALDQEALLQSLGGPFHLQAQTSLAPQRPAAQQSVAPFHVPEPTQSQDEGTPHVVRGRPAASISDATPSLLVFSGARPFLLSLLACTDIQCPAGLGATGQSFQHPFRNLGGVFPVQQQCQGPASVAGIAYSEAAE